MDLAQHIEQLAVKFENYPDRYTQNIEAIKYSFVLPLLKVMGYDLFDTQEVEPNYAVTDPTTSGQIVLDFAIRPRDSVEMLIHCNKPSGELSAQPTHPLSVGFSKSEASIGIKTNGIIYNFYTDMAQQSQIDETPFMILDISKIGNNNMRKRVIPKLEKLTRNNFDLEWIKSHAYTSKLSSQIQKYLEKQLQNPSQTFVNFIKSELPSENAARINDEGWVQSIQNVDIGQSTSEPKEEPLSESSESAEETQTFETWTESSGKESGIEDETEHYTQNGKAPEQDLTEGQPYQTESEDQDFELTPSDEGQEPEENEQPEEHPFAEQENSSSPTVNKEPTDSPTQETGEQAAESAPSATSEVSPQAPQQQGNYQPTTPELKKIRDEGVNLMKSIVTEIIDSHRISVRHYNGYSEIILNGSQNRAIVRFHYSGEEKYLGLFDANDKEYQIPIDSMEDIHHFADQIKLLAQMYHKEEE